MKFMQLRGWTPLTKSKSYKSELDFNGDLLEDSITTRAKQTHNNVAKQASIQKTLERSQISTKSSDLIGKNDEDLPLPKIPMASTALQSLAQSSSMDFGVENPRFKKLNAAEREADKSSASQMAKKRGPVRSPLPPGM